ncbi:MAG: hypothetical protein LBT62_07030, partial [Deltaproteobacteria bacterium]|nr:hypothetical protein [Deltaproteobacteria bacterium]
NVSKFTSFLAHPAALYAGLKARSFFAQSGYAQSFDLVAASPDGALQATDVTLTLYRRNWTTVRRRGPGSTYLYNSQAADEKIEEIALKTSDAVTEFQFTPPKSGYYWIKAALKDSKGNSNESSVTFYALGDDSVGWEYSNDDSLTIVSDKPEYAPGDTAKILVQSPFQSGQAFVTVERATISQKYVVDITSQAPVFDIPLTEDDGPNVFVSVILSQGRIAEKPDKNGVDLGKPAVRKGYIALKIPTNRDSLSVSVESDKPTYQPGADVTIKYQVTDRDGKAFSDAEVALVVVDAALIQLSSDETYFPDRSLHSDRPLSVMTVNPIDSLIGRRNWGLKGQPDGGGGALAEAAAPFNEGQRANFQSVAYFNPNLTLSPDGAGEATFKLPDNLTTFKVYATVTGHGRITGTGENQILVTKDLLLRSALPAFASLGDEFSASVILTNRSEQAGLAKVNIEATNLQLTGEKEFEIELAAGENKEVFFPVKASAMGAATLTFSLAMGTQTDQALFEIPVLPATALTTQASYRLIEAGKTDIAVSVPQGTDLDRSSLSVDLAPTILGVFSAPFQWLQQYPYKCIEQRTSKAFGSLLELRFKDRLGLSEERQSQAYSEVDSHIEALKQFNNNGGFNYWPNDYSWSSRSPVLTAYVLEFLVAAAKDGHSVPQSFLEEVTEYLSGQLREHDYSNSIEIYMIYALANAKKPMAPFIETYYQQINNLPLLELLYLARAIYLQDNSAVRTEQLAAVVPLILNHLDIAAGQARVSNPQGSSILWCDEDKLTALTFLTLAEIAPENEFLPLLARDLVSRAKKGYFSTTQSNVTALLAFDAYVKTAEPVAPSLKLSVTASGDEILSSMFTSFNDPATDVQVGLNKLEGLSNVEVSAEGTGQAWSTFKLATAPLTPDLEPEQSTNLVLSRSYQVVAPSPQSADASTFQRGQVVKVTVTMMTPDDRYNLVLVDRIPSGFEPLNFNLATEDQTLLTLINGSDDSGWSEYGSWYQYQEIWPEKVAVFASYLPAGVYTFSYLARPVTPGAYRIYGPEAEEMYSPETFGRGAGHTITVAKPQ